MKRVLTVLGVVLAGCGPWPETGGPPLSQSRGNWPELRPISELVRPQAVPTARQEDAEDLLARAEALRARARLMRRPVPNSDALEALRTRLAR